MKQSVNKLHYIYTVLSRYQYDNSHGVEYEGSSIT